MSPAGLARKFDVPLYKAQVRAACAAAAAAEPRLRDWLPARALAKSTALPAGDIRAFFSPTAKKPRTS